MMLANNPLMKQKDEAVKKIMTKKKRELTSSLERSKERSQQLSANGHVRANEFQSLAASINDISNDDPH